MNRASAAEWFSHFLECPFVSRVSRRIPIRSVKFVLSEWLVQIASGFGLPHTCIRSIPTTTGGEYRLAVSDAGILPYFLIKTPWSARGPNVFGIASR